MSLFVLPRRLVQATASRSLVSSTFIHSFNRPLSTNLSLNHSSPFKPKNTYKSYSVLCGTILGLGGLTWFIDKFFYGEALGRTVRLAYNAGVIILDYKLNFNPNSSPDQLHERVASRIAKTCITNGGLFIKLGQSIAIQTAILPTPYKKAFEIMFDAAKPLTFEQVLQVLNEEFKCNLSDHFSEFDPNPIACGSIAQVHRAKLNHSGQIVAVKVQRPDIQFQIELDLFAYRALLYVYEKIFDLPVYFIAHYVSDQIRKETDFLKEAQNSERTAKLFNSDPILKDKVYVPKVHWPLCTKRVLTTEFIEDGCRLTEESRIESKGLKKKEVMDLAMKMFSQMLFIHGWLHCDLHPGNVLVLEKNRQAKLALIDHGLYIDLPDEFRRDYCELWRSLFVLDTPSIDRIAKGWGIANSDLFASATLLRPFQARPKKSDNSFSSLDQKSTTSSTVTRDGSASSYESSLKIKELMKTILENQALIPQELIFIVRCMRMMQGNNQALGSPTNRINILAHGAAAGMTINAPLNVIRYRRNVSFITILKDWCNQVIKIWTFRTVLILVDFGFFLTQVRQWWLKSEIGRRKSNLRAGGKEGFEDLLQRQLENFAKEEFGVTLDDSAFLG